MRRRELLSLIPLTVGFGGCSSDSERVQSPSQTTREQGEGTPTTVRSPTQSDTVSPTAESPSSTGATATTVLRSAYRHRFYADAFRIVSPDRDQFAFVRPPENAHGRPPDEFELALGDRQYDPKTSLRVPPLMPRVDEVYTAEDPSGWLAFDIPTVAVETGALIAHETQYSVSNEFLTQSSRRADFSVLSVSIPESVSSGEMINLEVEVRNNGDREGIFLGGFQHSGLPKLVTLRIKPDETVSGVATYEAYPDSGSMAFRFHYSGGNQNYDVSITGTKTPETTARLNFRN